MKLLVGKVVGGRIDLQGGDALEEGATVTVLAHEAEGTFTLDRDAELRLVQAIEEADRGDLIDAEELLRALRPGG